jgi:hypothetical protein
MTLQCVGGQRAGAAAAGRQLPHANKSFSTTKQPMQLLLPALCMLLVLWMLHKLPMFL